VGHEFIKPEPPRSNCLPLKQNNRLDSLIIFRFLESKDHFGEVARLQDTVRQRLPGTGSTQSGDLGGPAHANIPG
jgi:hypothetical protein